MEILVNSGTEEFAKITPFEPTVAPSKVLQCKLSGRINFSCQFISISTSSPSPMNVIYSWMRKRWKSAVDDISASEDVFDSNCLEIKLGLVRKMLIMKKRLNH